MTTEQAKSLSEIAISQLIEALEHGQSEALKLYLKVMSRFHRYSWGNILLIQPAAGRHAHCWFPRLARDAPLRSQGRERHRHSGADGWP